MRRVGGSWRIDSWLQIKSSGDIIFKMKWMATFFKMCYAFEVGEVNSLWCLQIY